MGKNLPSLPLTALLSNIYFAVKEKQNDLQTHLIVMMAVVGERPMHLLMADDDEDDCLFFTDAIRQINADIKVTTVHNGVKLMKALTESKELPDIIFLDLNMPQKNGFECLKELKAIPRLKNVPVVIYSTTSHAADVNLTYATGANLYIQKPSQYTQIKAVLNKVLSLPPDQYVKQPERGKFIVT